MTKSMQKRMKKITKDGIFGGKNRQILDVEGKPLDEIAALREQERLEGATFNILTEEKAMDEDKDKDFVGKVKQHLKSNVAKDTELHKKKLLEKRQKKKRRMRDDDGGEGVQLASSDDEEAGQEYYESDDDEVAEAESASQVSIEEEKKSKKSKKEKKEKKPEGKKEMVYRPKVKEDEGPASEEHPKENHPQPKKDKKPTPEPKKETEQPKKPEPKATEPKVEEKTAEPAPVSKEETAVQSIVPKKSEKPKAPKKAKAEFGKENSNSAMNSSNKSSSDGFRLEIEQLQKLVLQKERDLGKLELLVDGQNRKMSALE
mmetsp:Transcript_3185/g.4852  ORF Transcript_3185/g.4852 Transcript_3185/m.4852 type:complete len:316 (-) Transcript_3185:171-1118(-)